MSSSIDAPSPPPPLPTNEDGFHARNWLRNGWACRIAVAFALLAVLNLFQPWEADYYGSGHSETHWEGERQVRRSYSGTTYQGGGNAFTEKQGWIPLIGLLGVLYACGRPRHSPGGMRWMPFGSGVAVLAYMLDTILDWDKKNKAWLATFSSPPVVVIPSAMLAVFWFALGVVISGWFFARKTANA